jgi:hypothetical protein
VISAAELESMQDTVAQTFTSTATVLRKVTVDDTQGGTTDSYPNTGLTYPCSYGRYPVRPVERENQPLLQLVTEWNFIFPLSADIRPTDRLLVDSRTFEVVDANAGSRDIVRRATCLEIT